MTFISNNYLLANCLKLKAFAVVLCLTLILPSIVCADSIIAIHDWDTTPADDLGGNWSASSGSASVTETNDVDDYLEITFGSIDPAPGPLWYDTISVPSIDLFAGTWISDYFIEFDFWAEDVIPEKLQIRWGDNTSGREWANSINTSGFGTQSWGTLRSDSFSDVENWRIDPFATQAEFITDLGSIDWIGVYIFRDGTDEEVYGVDDFKLMVPEPAEYLMLFAALGTAVVAIRRKKIALAVVDA